MCVGKYWRWEGQETRDMSEKGHLGGLLDGLTNLDGELMNLGMAGKIAPLFNVSPSLAASPCSLPLWVSNRFDQQPPGKTGLNSMMSV